MTIELFGTVRLRAGVGQVEVVATTIGQALDRLAQACPELLGSVIISDRVHGAYRLSLNGDRFVDDPNIALVDSDRLLLLSADVGG